MNAPDVLLDALRDVQDPEIPINIVDLGLVADVRSTGPRVEVDLTLTAMGCPAVEMMSDDIRERLLREPGVEEVRVELVWEPIWTPARLSADGRAELREMGIAL
jgi:phenylacetate-CoA oxygenase PaaJ subunit